MLVVKIVAIAGSLREDSLNKKLLHIAAKSALDAGAEVIYADLKKLSLPLYDQDIEQSKGIPDQAKELKEMFWESQGILVASPEYNSSISGALKNAIDWISRPLSKEEVYLSCFIDKVVALMSASPSQMGGVRGLGHVRTIFSSMGSLVLPKQKCIARADQAFDKRGNLIEDTQQQEVVDFGKELVDFLHSIKKP